MTKTNSGLVEYCKAQLGLPYWYGTFGQQASAALYEDKKNQYPKYYTAKDYPSQYGKRVHDCAGLIKGYLWSDTPTSTPKYDPKTDYGATAFYNHCSKKGKMDTFDHVPGRLLFKASGSKMSHVGVYIGNDEIIEAKGHSYGVVKTKLNDKWTNWGQCDLISEDSIPSPEPQPVPQPTPQPTPEPSTSSGCYRVQTNSGVILKIRQSPTTQSKHIGSINNGDTLYAQEIVKGESISGNSDWAKTTYKGVTGYASCKYLVKQSNAKTYTVSVSSYLNVRTGPGTNYPAVGKLYNEDVVSVYQTKGNWACIGNKQWVSMTYLK